MNSVSRNLLIVITLVVASGCSTTQYGVSATQDAARRDAAAHAERKVILGMGTANIAAVLGSPSIVSEDDNNETIWTYDGIASQLSYARSGNAIVGVIFDESYDNSIAKNNRNALQPTLTVVIRFNQHDRVRDLSYYASR